MSEGSIRRERQATTVPKLGKTPKPGDLVIPDDFPAGFPRWTVLHVPPAAGMSDILTLLTTDKASPVQKIRRHIYQVRLVT